MRRRKRCAFYLLSVIYEDKPATKRRFWTKKWLLERATSSHMSLLRELRQSHQEDLLNYLRMSEYNFNILLGMISPFISPMNTHLRQSISSEERLTATLRFLATGQSFEDLKFPTRISPQALELIIPETSKQIYLVLKDLYLKLPDSQEAWQATAKDFENRWNFPNCGGAIDGKHIRIKKPPNSGSYFYNYKGYCSIVLMAVVNADYEFIYVNVGCNCRVSDEGVIECTSFYRKLLNKHLKVPQNNVTKANRNFVFVADEAFALHENILKPHPQRQLTHDERIFNYRLSRARRTVETAFGILSSRYRIFHSEINMKPQKIDFVVLATCVLHNFLRKREKVTYMPVNSLDIEDIDSGEIIPGDREDDQLHSLQRGYGRNISFEDGKNNRDNYKNYFVGDGAVSWQDNFVNKA